LAKDKWIALVWHINKMRIKERRLDEGYQPIAGSEEGRCLLVRLPKKPSRERSAASVTVLHLRT
jgi:hypothetical protein